MRCHRKLAEREGFEPSMQVTPHGGLANRCTRPLCDLSVATAAGILSRSLRPPTHAGRGALACHSDRSDRARTERSSKREVRKEERREHQCEDKVQDRGRGEHDDWSHPGFTNGGHAECEPDANEGKSEEPD